MGFGNLLRLYLGNRAGVDSALRQMACGGQVAEPRRRERIDLVVVGRHGDRSPGSFQSSSATSAGTAQSPCAPRPNPRTLIAIMYQAADGWNVAASSYAEDDGSYFVGEVPPE